MSWQRLIRSAASTIVLVLVCLSSAFPVAAQSSFDVIRNEIATHPGQTGAFVLDTGEEALLARAWLVDNAERSIEVQYFIWSTDNVGILASEALLRAAERGVLVLRYIKTFTLWSSGNRSFSTGTEPDERSFRQCLGGYVV